MFYIIYVKRLKRIQKKFRKSAKTGTFFFLFIIMHIIYLLNYCVYPRDKSLSSSSCSSGQEKASPPKENIPLVVRVRISVVKCFTVEIKI